jgi:hypothetical protein
MQRESSAIVPIRAASTRTIRALLLVRQHQRAARATHRADQGAVELAAHAMDMHVDGVADKVLPALNRCRSSRSRASTRWGLSIFTSIHFALVNPEKPRHAAFELDNSHRL